MKEFDCSGCGKSVGQEIDHGRRTVLKSLSMGGLAGVSGGIALPFLATPVAKAVEKIGSAEETLVWNACLVNCGSRCPLKCHVVDGVIRWVSQEDNNGSGTDEFGSHQVRACLRGRSARRRVYNPDRLRYPMKRVGKRGEGKFARISWDEAIKIVGDQLKYTIDKYGNDAIYYQYGSGSTGYNFGGRSSCQRFLRLIGGYVEYYGTYSEAQSARAVPFTFGAGFERSLTSEIGNARLCVFFGYSPAENRMSGGGETYQVNEWRQKNNTKMVYVDPRYSDSMLGKEDEWIPLRPGTDAALVNGIAHVLISENLVDQAFLDTYCVGYDEKTLPASAPANGSYKAYILGQGPDGVAKTPAWAANITGVPMHRIIALAREIGTAKPVFVAQGWSVQRQANGEQTSRAIAMLPILTGNIGLPGTNCGGDELGNYGYPMERLPLPPNKVKAKIPCFLWTDAITRGKEMTALADGVQGVEKLSQSFKFIWNYSSNTLINQHSDTAQTHRILQDESLCEFIVVFENHMTPSARYADVLLPDITNFENSDIIQNGYAVGEMGGPIFLSPAIQPMFECKSAWDICTLLARHFGVEEQYTEGKTFEQWLEGAYAKMRLKDAELPDLQTARAMGMIKRKAPPGSSVGMAKFRADPQASPLKTPSGKIEIYSERLAEIAATWTLPAGDVISALPQYVPTWESSEDTETKKKYPLQMYARHPKGRTHSTYHDIDLLRQAVTDSIWINPIDAETRNVRNGDMVRVTSQRGEIRLLATVTPRIMPGVTSMTEGAWYAPDAKGIDHGGCANTLTSQRPSPLAKGNPQHTNLVQIERV